MRISIDWLFDWGAAIFSPPLSLFLGNIPVAIRILSLLLMVVMTACGRMDGRTDGRVGGAPSMSFLNTIDEMNVRRIVHAGSVSSVLFFFIQVFACK